MDLLYFGLFSVLNRLSIGYQPSHRVKRQDSTYGRPALKSNGQLQSEMDFSHFGLFPAHRIPVHTPLTFVEKMICGKDQNTIENTKMRKIHFRL